MLLPSEFLHVNCQLDQLSVYMNFTILCPLLALSGPIVLNQFLRKSALRRFFHILAKGLLVSHEAE